MSYIDQHLCHAAMRGDVDKVSKLLSEGADPKFINSRALAMAACFGHIDCLMLLLPVSDPKNSLALQWAAEWGRVDCVKLLIPVSDPKADDSIALRFAAHNGHAECVKLLEEAASPSAPSKPQNSRL